MVSAWAFVPLVGRGKSCSHFVDLRTPESESGERYASTVKESMPIYPGKQSASDRGGAGTGGAQELTRATRDCQDPDRTLGVRSTSATGGPKSFPGRNEPVDLSVRSPKSHTISLTLRQGIYINF